jgi:hypothetical protein
VALRCCLTPDHHLERILLFSTYLGTDRLNTYKLSNSQHSDTCVTTITQSFIMGMSYRQYLSGPRIYGCSACKTHLASISSMISRVSHVLVMLKRYAHTLGLGIPWPAWAGLSLRGGVCDHLSSSPCFDPLLTTSYSVNVVEGEPIDRQMTTGNHTVRDISCCKCGTTLGWKYVSTHTYLRLAMSAFDADP